MARYVTLLFSIAAIGAPAQTKQKRPIFKVIVHPDNPAPSISSEALRQFYLKKVTFWPHKVVVQPIDLPKQTAERQAFTVTILRRSLTAQLNYWRHHIFTGRGVPPTVLRSPADALKYVLQHKGAVAYVPAEMEVGSAKVLPVM